MANGSVLTVLASIVAGGLIMFFEGLFSFGGLRRKEDFSTWNKGFFFF